MVQLNKMLIELTKINGKEDLQNNIDFQRFSNEDVCRQASLGNKIFIIELLRRSEASEEEGDYLIANELFKQFIKGML